MDVRTVKAVYLPMLEDATNSVNRAGINLVRTVVKSTIKPLGSVYKEFGNYFYTLGRGLESLADAEDLDDLLEEVFPYLDEDMGEEESDEEDASEEE